MKTKRGFTVLEILGVIAIIGILALITVPVYHQIAPHLSLDSATRDIVSDLRYAQQLAVTEQVVYRVVFDIGQNKYSIVNSVSGQTVRNKNLNPRVLILQISELTDNTANFNATGAATESGSLVLISTDNSTSTINIKPSGYVEIK